MHRTYPALFGIFAVFSFGLLRSFADTDAPGALPDLVVYAPASTPHVVYRTFATNDCTVHEGCAVAGIRRLLSFNTQTRNVGTADLIMGNPATNSLFYYDPCHNHYHFEGFAEYRLLRASDLALVAPGRKIGFCLEDIVQWDPNANVNRKYDCSYQGIQRGWADVYTEDVSCQWIDVTGLPGGDYILEMETNPNRDIRELNYSNNIARVPVTITDDCTPVVGNDDFGNAEQIPASPFSFKTYNGCATKEAGEPNHAGNAGGHSIWYRGTALYNSIVRLDTEGSDFDTLLAVYTGNAVNALTLVASNDDASPSNHLSRLSFNAIAGTEYKIAVDGRDGGYGGVVLNINSPLNNAFNSCTSISGMAGTITGYNIGATKELNEPDHNGNYGGHSVWYCWSPTNSGPYIFDTIGSDFDTTLGVYTGNAVDALTVIASDNDSGSNFTSRVLFDAVAGTTYHIAVDGVSGGTGNITLNWSPTCRLTVAKLSASTMQLTLNGAPSSYRLEASSNLVQWITLTTIIVSNSPSKFNDTSAGALKQRFYRAIR